MTSDAAGLLSLAGWQAFHIFYHSDRNRVLVNLVRPLVSSLWAAGTINSFFFIRYMLGGAHLRLRLHVTHGRERSVAAEVETSVSSFLARWPSSQSCDEEAIRHVNRTIIANDPNEQEDTVFPDNHLVAAPFRPEIARYGGRALLPYSLDFFTVSSLQALRLMTDHSSDRRSRQLAVAFRLLARQLWSFATSEDEGYAVLEGFISHRRLRPISSYGDSAYEQQRAGFQRLLASEIEALMAPKHEIRTGIEASRRLSWEIREADTETRRRIGVSQLHMTANRFGITNPEEVYLGSLLGHAARDLASAEPDLWQRAWDAQRKWREVGGGRLSQLREQALADYFS